MQAIEINDPVVLKSVEDYKNGMHVDEIIKNNPIKKTHLYYVLKMAGLTRQKPFRPPFQNGDSTNGDVPEIEETVMERKLKRAIALYSAGKKMQHVARVCKINRASVYRKIHELGLPLQYPQHAVDRKSKPTKKMTFTVVAPADNPPKVATNPTTPIGHCFDEIVRFSRALGDVLDCEIKISVMPKIHRSAPSQEYPMEEEND